MIKLTRKFFSGSGKVFEAKDDGLAAILQSLATNQARIAAALVTDLTDNGGGTADGAIAAKSTVDNYLLVGSNGTQKANLETALGTVKDALMEVVAQINAVRTVIPAFAALTNNIGGTAADGTVGAITQSTAGVNTSLASAVGVRAVRDNLYNAIVQATYFVNQLAKAVNVSQITLPVGVVPSVSTTFAAINVGTGTAVSGADATNTNAGVSKTQSDAMLANMANNVKELTAKLNVITSSNPVISVIAA